MASGEIKYRLGLDVGNVPAASAQASKAIESIGKSGQSSAAQTVTASSQLSKAVDGVARSSTISAAQTAAAMRQLPAQFTDIATQLQGGTSPLTVLLQQGGQIKDSFGGIGPAFKALTGLITPTGLALTGAATALGGYALALHQAQADSVALDNALRLTNNSAGLTQGSFEGLTASVAKAADITRGTAREAAQAVAGSGLFNSTTATEAAKSIALFAKATGRDAVDALAIFESFTKDASGAAAKLNERVHFLTSDTYAHIVALQAQGKNSEAAALAMKAFNERMEESAPKLTTMGTLLDQTSKLWDRFWSAAKGQADPSASIESRLDQAKKRLAELQGPTPFANAGVKSRVEAMFGGEEYQQSQIWEQRQLIDILSRSKKLADDVTKSTTRSNTDKDRATEAENYFQKLRLQTDAQYKLNNAVAEYRRMVDAKEGTPQAIPLNEQEKQLKWIREQNADRQGMAAYEARLSLRLASERAASTLRLSLVDDEEARLAIARSAGLVSFDDIEARRVAIQRHRLAEKAELLKQELAIESQRRPTDDAGRINQQAKLADIRAQQSAVQGEISRVALESQARINERALQEAQGSAREYSQLYMQAAEMSQQLAAQTATGMAMMITDPLDRARAEAEVSVQALLRNTERMRVVLQNQIDILRGTAEQAIEAGDASRAAELRSRADVLQGQLGGIQAGTQGAARGIRMKAEASVVDDYLKSTDIGNNIAQGFDRASQSLATYVQSFSKLVDEQRNYESMLRADGLTDEKRMQLNRQHAMAQIDGYGNMAAAAKGFFQEGSRGYRTLETAERTFRAIELASAVQAAATKLGLLGAVTTAKLATDATQAASDTARSGIEQGNSLSTAAVKGVEAVVNAIRTLPFPLNLAAGAATAAAIAALGVSITGGGFGGSSGGFASTNEGTGTVLGDGGAKSESVTKSIEALKDVDTLTMRYSAGMLASLKSIESNIGGLAALLVQSGGLSASAAGVQTGFQRDALGNGISAFYGLTSKSFDAIPIVGKYLSGINGAIGSALSGLFGTKTSIQGQGLIAGAQSITQILADGFQAQYYTDIERKRKVFGITTSTSRSTQYTDADPLLERQLGTVFGNFAKSVESAAAPLGVSLAEVDRRINSFVVDIGRIDLKDLSGTQIQERLTAVLSAAGDRLASSALGGFEAFQKVGEGYLQTITRTAIGVETAQQALDRLNVTAVSLANVMNKQGDVAVELIRDSILAKEGLSGIADILGTLDGSASDLASTYKSLTDVRTSLQLLGLNGSAVGRSLINGADGLQSLTDSIAAYEKGFLTQSQQVDIQAQRIALQFANLGLVMPSTSEQFVAMVKGIDTSSNAGQKLLGSVLNLSGGFADLMSAIKSVGSGIADEIARIKSLSATSAAQSYGSLQATFAVRTAQARAGDQSAIDELPKISQGLLDAARASAASSLDYALAQSRTLASLQETLSVISDPSSRLTNVPVFASATTLMGGGQEEVIAELRALRTEMEAIKSGQRDGFAAVATHASNTASILSRVCPDGDAIVTTPLV